MGDRAEAEALRAWSASGDDRDQRLWLRAARRNGKKISRLDLKAGHYVTAWETVVAVYHADKFDTTEAELVADTQGKRLFWRNVDESVFESASAVVEFGAHDGNVVVVCIGQKTASHASVRVNMLDPEHVVYEIVVLDNLSRGF